MSLKISVFKTVDQIIVNNTTKGGKSVSGIQLAENKVHKYG